MTSERSYIIRGGDGLEYGPVTAQRLRDWFRQGRANAFTWVRVVGEPGGGRLGDMPEFSDLFPVAMPGPGVGPRVVAAGAGVGVGAGERLAREVIAGGRRVRIGECFGGSWALMQRRFLLTAGASVLIWVLHFAMGLLPVVGLLASIALTFVLYGGLDILFLRLARGERPELTVVFVGFGAALGTLVLASLAAYLLTFLGFCLCVLPAVYLIVAWWMFTPLLILDRGLGCWEAMECSRQVVTANWWACFGLALLSVLVLMGGTLLLLVGLVVAIPWATGAIVIAYEQLFGRPATAETGLAPAGPLAPIAPPPAPPAGPESVSEPVTASPAPEADSGRGLERPMEVAGGGPTLATGAGGPPAGSDAPPSAEGTLDARS